MNFKQERIAKLETEMQIQHIDEDVWEIGKPLLPHEYFDDEQIEG